MASVSPHHSGNPSKKFIKDKQGKMIVPPKDLNIVWGKDNRYWNVPDKEDLPVELYQVCWLEVTGFVRETSPSTDYEVGFCVSFNPDAFGWGKYPIYIMVKKGKEGKIAWTKIAMNSDRKGEFEIAGRWVVKSEKQVQDSNDGNLYFGLYEVWSGKWKGGLKIHHAFIRELPRTRNDIIHAV